MELYFEVKNGPNKGLSFPIAVGLSLGKTQCDIDINDAKIEDFHAKVEMDSEGRIVLQDQGTREGLKVNDKTRRRIILKPGVEIQMGNTILIVQEEKLEVIDQDIQDTVLPNTILRQQEDAFETPKKWHEILLDELKNIEDKFSNNKKQNLEALNPALYLKVISGAQKDQAWTLGYGPRMVGKRSLDIIIQDNEAPDLCFEIVPGKKGCLFKTGSSDEVLLNNKSISEATLKQKDKIKFGKTVIEVNFVK